MSLPSSVDLSLIRKRLETNSRDRLLHAVLRLFCRLDQFQQALVNQGREHLQNDCNWNANRLGNRLGRIKREFPLEGRQRVQEPLVFSHSLAFLSLLLQEFITALTLVHSNLPPSVTCDVLCHP